MSTATSNPTDELMDSADGYSSSGTNNDSGSSVSAGGYSSSNSDSACSEETRGRKKSIHSANYLQIIDSHSEN